MMINHPEASSSKKAQDALIEWVWSGMSQASPPQAKPKPAPSRGKR
jgi:hypothetical protein